MDQLQMLQLYMPKLILKKRHEGISAFIVEKGTPGFAAGPPIEKMGVRTSQTSELIFNNCEIPEENLLGKEGNGFFMSLETVEWDRSALLAPFIGATKYILDRCIDYAKKKDPIWQAHR